MEPHREARIREPSDLRVLFLGCGDLGTGAAHRLFRAGLHVAVVELASPLAVRRRVAFAEAARSGEIVIEGVSCQRTVLEDLRQARRDFVPLVVASIESALAAFAPHVVVDARMAKRRLGPPPASGAFVVALGPGHEAGRDCGAVVETLRGADLGCVYWSGGAHADTGEPGDVGGFTAARVLRAPRAGTLRLRTHIGARLQAGDLVAEIEGECVRAAVAGMVRGLLPDGVVVASGQKLGDIDPRAEAPPVDRISDKARAVGEGVLQAVVERFQIPFAPQA